MPINTGYIEMSNEQVTVRIYYDATAPVGNQPLINGPRGFCLDMKNLTGTNARITLIRPNGAEVAVTVGQGDPVTGGPVAGRSRTAAQMSALGFNLRTDIPSITLAPTDT